MLYDLVILLRSTADVERRPTYFADRLTLFSHVTITFCTPRREFGDGISFVQSVLHIPQIINQRDFGLKRLPDVDHGIRIVVEGTVTQLF